MKKTRSRESDDDNNGDSMMPPKPSPLHQARGREVGEGGDFQKWRNICRLESSDSTIRFVERCLNKAKPGEKVQCEDPGALNFYSDYVTMMMYFVVGSRVSKQVAPKIAIQIMILTRYL